MPCLPPRPPRAADTCDVRIQAGRRGGSRWIPLNEVYVYTRAGRLLDNNTAQATLVSAQGKSWSALACVDSRNDTSCFDPNATASANVSLVIKVPCSGSGLDELNKLVLVNTK